jgi:hypothetical protein
MRHRRRPLRRRLVRRAGRGGALVAVVSVLAYVAKLVVDERRHERRLAAPFTAWPDVPTDRPEPWSGRRQAQGNHHPGAAGGAEG